jgi:hypothetical protein
MNHVKNIIRRGSQNNGTAYMSVKENSCKQFNIFALQGPATVALV